jgi:NADPH-dependent curcumin reductase CurA
MAIRRIAYFSGKLKTREDIVEGLETILETFQKLFTNGNNGKLMLKVQNHRNVV